MSAPICDWATLPVTLRIREVASIYSMREDTVRKQLRIGDASLPLPFADRPYRFRKSDVQRHYERLELSDIRRARARMRRQTAAAGEAAR